LCLAVRSCDSVRSDRAPTITANLARGQRQQRPRCRTNVRLASPKRVVKRRVTERKAAYVYALDILRVRASGTSTKVLKGKPSSSVVRWCIRKEVIDVVYHESAELTIKVEVKL